MGSLMHSSRRYSLWALFFLGRMSAKRSCTWGFFDFCTLLVPLVTRSRMFNGNGAALLLGAAAVLLGAGEPEKREAKAPGS